MGPHGKWLLLTGVLVVGAIVGSGCTTLEEEPEDAAYGAGYSYSYEPLYDRLGGERALTRVVDEVLVRVTANPDLVEFFEGANLPLLRTRLVEMLSQMTGGPAGYAGMDMRSAHAGMEISHADFDSFAADVLAVLTQLGVPKRERRELMALLAETRADIVMAAPDNQIAHELAGAQARIAALEAEVAELRAHRATPPGAAASSSAPPLRPMPAATARSSPTASQAGNRGAVAIADPRTGSEPGADSAAAMAFASKLTTYSRKWLQEEVEFARDELIERYKTKKARPPSPRPDLLDKPVNPSRLLSDRGRVLDLAQYRGKRVVLVILRGFKGQVCLHCSSQTLALCDEAKEFTERDCQVVLVYPGPAETVPIFLDAVKKIDPKFEPPFPIALDVDLSLTRALQIEASLAQPTTLILDREGKVNYAFVGKVPAHRPSIAQILAEVDRLP